MSPCHAVYAIIYKYNRDIFSSTGGVNGLGGSDCRNITIALDEAETDDLPVGNWTYDVQVLTTGDVVNTLTTNTFTVVADVTRSVA